MNMAVAPSPVEEVAPLPTGFEHFQTLARDISDLRELLLDLGSLTDPTASRALRKLEAQLAELEPSVTMIGQVKAGKTTLVNAMIGRPDFLPADVNPWTSVVTSLHLNAHRPEGAPAAVFQLFKPEEWDNLLLNGGRLGELARNANADEELRRIQAQLMQMRDKTRQRLGRKFELLLGQQHDYDRVTEDLIQRYVCMGDDPSMGGADLTGQGRFADITRSADIFLDAPHIPGALCLRDTPGVNDTFLMREQITINALRSSRLCVVVLSAQQALTTTDMAMIRMIANVEARDLIIFVNRIDELDDPFRQTDEIRCSIKATLEEHNAPKDVDVIFGSAHWAMLASQGRTEAQPADHQTALRAYAEAGFGEAASSVCLDDLAWSLSGIPDLFSALGHRIARGEAAETLRSVRTRAINVAQALQVSNSLVSIKLNGESLAPIDVPAVKRRLSSIEAGSKAALDARLSQLEQDFSIRIERLQVKFVDRALETLLRHLDSKTDNEVWHYSADGLRVLLRTSFLVLSQNYTKSCRAIFIDVASELEELYEDALNVTTEGFAIAPPDVPRVSPPVTLGATIALDLSRSWWRSLWDRRKGASGRAAQYRDLLDAEIAPLIAQLKSAHVAEIRQAAEATLAEFVETQSQQLLEICAQTDRDEHDLRRIFGVVEMEDNAEILQSLIDDLSSFEETFV